MCWLSNYRENREPQFNLMSWWSGCVSRPYPSLLSKAGVHRGLGEVTFEHHEQFKINMLAMDIGKQTRQTNWNEYCSGAKAQDHL